MAKLDVNIWMPLYIGDFLRDTTGLDTEMIAEYILLYVAIWTKAGPLPDDNERLARICRMTTERFIETREELSSLFDVRDGGWSHDDLLAERAKWVETRRKKKAESSWPSGRQRDVGQEKEIRDKPSRISRRRVIHHKSIRGRRVIGGLVTMPGIRHAFNSYYVCCSTRIPTALPYLYHPYVCNGEGDGYATGIRQVCQSNATGMPFTITCTFT